MTATPTWRDHRYRSACNRLDLFARDYPGPESDSRPPLLLMHGLTRNSADFEPLAGLLAGEYQMIVPDQRGRGNSQWDSDPENYRPDVYAADMFALLDSLGIDKVTIVGTSMGGLIAMVMVAMQPQRIAGIVFNDVGPHIETEGLTRIQGYVGKSQPIESWDDAVRSVQALNGPFFPDFGPQDWRDFARRTCRERDDGSVVSDYDPAIATSANAAAIASPPDLWPLWALADAIPVLVIRGAMSDLLSAETVGRMGANHSGPFADAEVPNRAHAPILDEPVAIAAIRDFLSRYSG